MARLSLLAHVPVEQIADNQRMARFTREVADRLNALVTLGILQQSDINTWTINTDALPASGVVAGSYTTANITVNAQGLLTAASTGDAYDRIQEDASNLTRRRTLNFGQGLTASDDAGNTRTNVILPNSGVTANTYTNSTITVNAMGIVTSAASGTASGISPLTTKGDIWAYSSADARFPVGSDASILVVDAAATFGFKWVAVSGDFTFTTGGVATIPNNTVTYAKMQDVSAASKLLGRGDSGSGDPQEITLGSNLSMSGTTLNVATGLTSPLTTKGDIWVYSTADTRLAIGTNGYLLTPDSSATPGMKWDTVSNVLRGKVGGPPIVIVKTGNTDTASDATSNADPDLTFSVGNAETWCIQYFLFVTGNTSADIRIAISTPTSSTGTFTSFGLVSTATTSGNLQTDGETLSGGLSGDHGTAAPGAGVIGLLAWAGVFTGSSGSITLYWAQLSSNINNTTLMKGSFLVAHRVA